MGGSAGGCRSAAWSDNPLGGRRVDYEQVSRADGSPDELAATVRTDPVQDVLRAVAAPGALVTANEHVRGCRTEIPVAAFAIRPQLQHVTSIDRQPRLKQASIPPPARFPRLRDSTRRPAEPRLGADQVTASLSGMFGDRLHVHKSRSEGLPSCRWAVGLADTTVPIKTKRNSTRNPP